mmetsp:Transcript_15938/g.47547  ORF Transcript_15938/g.47547 Transcript_15938/m.47547 type:complete len:189 (+) Transcript_15938:507-1073(+)
MRARVLAALYVLLPAITLADERLVEVRLSVTVDAEGNTKQLVIPAGEEPELKALEFCRESLGAIGRENRTLLGNCVLELAQHATVERVRRALPQDAPLPALTLQVEVDEQGGTVDFHHAEDGDVLEEATAWCAEFTDEPEHKLIVESCAERLVVSARRKVIEMTVATESREEFAERRKAVDAILDARM